MSGINAYTVLILHGDLSLVDASPSGHTVSALGSAASSSAQKEFGSGSLYSPGTTGSGFSVPNSADFNVLSGDCGIDFWLRLVGTPSSVTTIIGLVDGTGNSDPDISWVIYSYTDRKVYFLIADNGNAEPVYLVSTTALNLNQWYHVAIGCKAGRYDLYVNGVSEAHVTPSAYTPKSPAWTLKIGYGFGYQDGYRINGYWDELRIQKGECDYASGVTFTPPTAPYSSDSWVTGGAILGGKIGYRQLQAASGGAILGGSSAIDGAQSLTAHEVWIATSGGQYWGGCFVYASTDGASYKLVGKIIGPARYGVLSASIPSGSDPDTMHTLSVDLTVSKGQLLSGTQQDADQYVTLCKVEDELLSYVTATFTAAYKYDLTKLRRGAFGSPITSHSVGASFVRLDNALFKYAYPPNMYGQQVWLKFVSFNLWGGGVQDLADVTEYPFTLRQ